MENEYQKLNQHDVPAASRSREKWRRTLSHSIEWQGSSVNRNHPDLHFHPTVNENFSHSEMSLVFTGPSGDSLRFKKITSNFEVGSGPNNKVDILIVLDNSLSMSQEQQKMSERFSGFIQSLEGLDWQLGIATTDMASGKSYSDGRLIKLYNRSFILDSKIDVDFATEIFSEKI